MIPWIIISLSVFFPILDLTYTKNNAIYPVLGYSPADTLVCNQDTTIILWCKYPHHIEEVLSFENGKLIQRNKEFRP